MSIFSIYSMMGGEPWWRRLEKETSLLEKYPVAAFLRSQAENPGKYLDMAEQLCWQDARLETIRLHGDWASELDVNVIEFLNQRVEDDLISALMQGWIMAYLKSAPEFGAEWNAMAPEKRRFWANDTTELISICGFEIVEPGHFASSITSYAFSSPNTYYTPAQLAKIPQNPPLSEAQVKLIRLTAPFSDIAGFELHYNYEDYGYHTGWVGIKGNKLLIAEYHEGD